MRIGILTFHYGDNYGAVLQAYGLQEKLRALGHDPRILDFRYPSGAELKITVKRAVLRCINFLQGHRTDHAAQLQQRQRFADFRAKHLQLSPHLTVDQLPAIVDDYDAFVVGSDQVWNADFWTEPRLAYFLDFCKGNPRVRKLSYAACFGQPDQPAYYLSHLDKWLSNFDYLSVRGESGRALIRAHTNHPVVSVVDPTMLWHFDDIVSPATPYSGCVLVYTLSRHIATDIREVAEQLVKESPRPVVSLSSKTQYPYANHYVEGSGPSEFLRLVRDASYVCTDSYHGTLFAVKARVPFISFNRGARLMRIHDALTAFGLGERLVRCADEVRTNHLLTKGINYEGVHERIERGVRESVRFLEEALQ